MRTDGWSDDNGRSSMMRKRQIKVYELAALRAVCKNVRLEENCTCFLCITAQPLLRPILQPLALSLSVFLQAS
jgi:hypothetical protein